MKFFNKDTRNQKCSLYNLKFLNLSGNSHVEDQTFREIPRDPQVQT